MAEKKKPGRKKGVLMTPDADRIKAASLRWIEAGGTLADFLRQPGMPPRGTFDEWRRNDQAFAEQYARARDDGADAIAEQAYEIIDTKPERGPDNRIDPGWVQLQKLRAEMRLKLLAKWNPKKYGDAVKMTMDGDLSLRVYDGDTAKRMAEQLLKGGK